MITVLLITFFILLIVFVMIASCERDRVYNDYDDEVVTTTVTTTTINEPKTQVFDDEIVGELVRKKSRNQYYVIDPVDGDKVWLNDNDDMYEDGAGKIWKLK